MRRFRLMHHANRHRERRCSRNSPPLSDQRDPGAQRPWRNRRPVLRFATNCCDQTIVTTPGADGALRAGACRSPTRRRSGCSNRGHEPDGLMLNGTPASAAAVRPSNAPSASPREIDQFRCASDHVLQRRFLASRMRRLVCRRRCHPRRGCPILLKMRDQPPQNAGRARPVAGQGY